MSQRMTDERWAGLKAAPMWGKGEREVVRNELTRARSEEARLLEENRKQEEQLAYLVSTVEVLQRSEAAQTEAIKALADALEMSGHQPGQKWHTYHCHASISPGCTDDCAAAVAALRLAGR